MNQKKWPEIFSQFPVNHCVTAFKPAECWHIIAWHSRTTSIVKINQNVFIGNQFMESRQNVPKRCNKNEERDLVIISNKWREMHLNSSDSFLRRSTIFAFIQWIMNYRALGAEGWLKPEKYCVTHSERERGNFHDWLFISNKLSWWMLLFSVDGVVRSAVRSYLKRERERNESHLSVKWGQEYF